MPEGRASVECVIGCRFWIVSVTENHRFSQRERAKEVGVSTRENPSSPAPDWTYRMEVSPTGQNPTAAITNTNDPILLLHLLANLQSQTLEVQRQSLEVQRQ